MDLLLDDNLDIDLSTGRARWVTGPQRLQQQLKLLFGLHRGQWFFDQELGVDWRGLVLRKAPDLVAIRVQLVEVIRSASLVQELVSYSQTYNANTRSLVVLFKVAMVEVAGQGAQVVELRFDVDASASDGGVVALLELVL